MKSVDDIMDSVYKSCKIIIIIIYAEICRKVSLRVVVVTCFELQNVGHIDNCYGNNRKIRDTANGMGQYDLVTT